MTEKGSIDFPFPILEPAIKFSPIEQRIGLFLSPFFFPSGLGLKMLKVCIGEM